jgi:hypothetical protein
VLLTRQIRTISKLEKQAGKHQAAVQAAEEGLLAAQHLLEAQTEKLAGIQSRLKEAESKRDDLLANLHKASASGAIDEDDPPPKEDRDPLTFLDTAVLPHNCTFLGQLLSVTGSPEELATLANTVGGKLGQHLPDPHQAAMRLLGTPPDEKAPALGTNTAALPPAAALAPLPAAAAAGTGPDNGPTEVVTPALKQRATEKAKAASPLAESAAGLPTAEAAAVSSGEDADDDDTDRGSDRKSRSPRERERPTKNRDPHEPRSPTPEHEGLTPPPGPPPRGPHSAQTLVLSATLLLDMFLRRRPLLQRERKNGTPPPAPPTGPWATGHTTWAPD